MPGIRIEPSAATSATAEPEISAKNMRRADRHVREPAAHPAEQRRGEGDQPLRDARRVHDRAGEDEQRDREQREAGRAVVGDDRQVGQDVEPVRRDHRDDRDDAERHGDRHVDQHQREHGGEQQQHDGHRAIARRQCVPSASAAPPRGGRRASAREQVDEMQHFGDRRSAPRRSGSPTARRSSGSTAGSPACRWRGSARIARADPAEQREERDHDELRRRSSSARRARQRHRVDELGAADVRALDRRQRRAVEREPGEQDRGDLVVPDSEWPTLRNTTPSVTSAASTTISAMTTPLEHAAVALAEARGPSIERGAALRRARHAGAPTCRARWRGRSPPSRPATSLPNSS